MANTNIKKIMESELYKEIRKDLINQLDANGTVGKHFKDLVDDYMELWMTKCMLVDDIHKRGINVKYNNGGGQKGMQDNKSIEKLIKVNSQMISLLDKLGIKSIQSDSGNDAL